jgi:CRISPR-associated protein Csb2
MLSLEVELLTDVYRANAPDGSHAEWPPHPERVFSALTQAWDEGGQIASDRQALEWLESLASPTIEADPSPSSRDAPVVYVPPNDPRGDEINVLPEMRSRQARAFRAVTPDEPRVYICWD